VQAEGHVELVTPRRDVPPKRYLEKSISRRVWWMPTAALAATVLVALFIGFATIISFRESVPNGVAGRTPEQISQVAVFRCELDSHGRIFHRLPLNRRAKIQSGDGIQVEVTVNEPLAFVLYHIHPVGNVVPLHAHVPGDGRWGQKGIVPGAGETLQLDETLGWETLLVMPGSDTKMLLAQVENSIASSVPDLIVRGSDRKLAESEVNTISRSLLPHGAKVFVFEHLPK